MHVPHSNIYSSFLEPALVDKALEQSRTYSTYAVVPLPAIEELLEWVSTRDGKTQHFRWWLACGLPGWDFREAEQNADGDIVLCLLDKDHDGDHGWPASAATWG